MWMPLQYINVLEAVHPRWTHASVQVLSWAVSRLFSGRPGSFMRQFDQLCPVVTSRTFKIAKEEFYPSTTHWAIWLVATTVEFSHVIIMSEGQPHNSQLPVIMFQRLTTGRIIKGSCLHSAGTRCTAFLGIITGNLCWEHGIITLSKLSGEGWRCETPRSFLIGVGMFSIDLQ